MKEKVIELINKRIKKYELGMTKHSKTYADLINDGELGESEMGIINDASNGIKYNTAAWFEIKSLLGEIEDLYKIKGVN